MRLGPRASAAHFPSVCASRCRRRYARRPRRERCPALAPHRDGGSTHTDQVPDPDRHQSHRGSARTVAARANPQPTDPRITARRGLVHTVSLTQICVGKSKPRRDVTLFPWSALHRGVDPRISCRYDSELGNFREPPLYSRSLLNDLRTTD